MTHNDSVTRIEFGQTFTINEKGEATRTYCANYFDDISAGHDETGTEFFSGIPSGWELVSGLTGQYGYSGPLMHSSEYMTEHNMAQLFDESDENEFVFVTLYAANLCVGICECGAEIAYDCHDEPFLDCWAILRRDSDTVTEPCCYANVTAPGEHEPGCYAA